MVGSLAYLESHTNTNQQDIILYLSLKNISKSYGDLDVLNDVSLVLHAGQKVGLVGANGAGKSTLLKIAVGEVEADAGTINRAPSIEMGYLAQTLEVAEGQTIDQLLVASQERTSEIETVLRTLEEQMAQPAGDLGQIFAQYGQLTEQFERLGGYDLAYRMAQVLAGLRVDHLPRHRGIATLSGGEKSRVGLAALLLSSPDLLLLDEPTNHLDFETLEWLEGYLKAYQGAVLVVSHDRQFLNETVESIVEIGEHSRESKVYSGNYDFYAEVKVKERQQWIERYQTQQEEIWELRDVVRSKARNVAHNRPIPDGDKFLKVFKAGRVEGVIARNVRNAEERLRRIEEDPVPKPPQELEISTDFDPQFLANRIPVVVSGLRKSYGAQVILGGVDFALNHDSRVVIVGPNGAGKSTLLRILASLEAADDGRMQIANSVVLGYLDQEQGLLSQSGTIFDAYRNNRIGDPEEFKAELLRYRLFAYDDLQKQVATLSTGQKRKLQIACLIAQQANVLLLDEPTNHISLDVLEEFEQALLDFPGPIIAVSHDRRFIQRFANQIWTLEDGTLRCFLGSWEEFRVRE